MEPLDDPFASIHKILDEYKIGRNTNAIFIDFHGEATSEKLAMAHMIDGKVSAVIGTHTHVPTADLRILPGGTAYQTDAGMCGNYDSVIGMEKQAAVDRFLGGGNTRLSVALGPVTLAGVIVETNNAGLATAVYPLRRGGVLSAT